MNSWQQLTGVFACFGLGIWGWLSLSHDPPTPLLVEKRIIPIYGELHHASDLSGIGQFNSLLLLVADEGNELQVLQPWRDGYKVLRQIPLNTTGHEIDLEAIACSEQAVYLLGSHSRTRVSKKHQPVSAQAWQSLSKIDADTSRDVIMQLTLDQQGRVQANKSQSLRKWLENHPLLAPFSQIPGKENGIDFEGLAYRDGLLYVGCRGPVLRDGWVPVLVGAFDTMQQNMDIRFVCLNGLGIRELTAVKGGFLILAGPVNHSTDGFHFYFWNGINCLNKTKETHTAQGQCTYLASFKHLHGGSPEGVCILEETTDYYDMLVTFDGLSAGAVRAFRLSKQNLINR